MVFIYLADIGSAGEALYTKLDDHGFNFATNFRLINTKNKKELSNITCEYKTTHEHYHSKEHYFGNDAKNLKN